MPISCFCAGGRGGYQRTQRLRAPTPILYGVCKCCVEMWNYLWVGEIAMHRCMFENVLCSCRMGKCGSQCVNNIFKSVIFRLISRQLHYYQDVIVSHTEAALGRFLSKQQNRVMWLKRLDLPTHDSRGVRSLHMTYRLHSHKLKQLRSSNINYLPPNSF